MGILDRLGLRVTEFERTDASAPVLDPGPASDPKAQGSGVIPPARSAAPTVVTPERSLTVSTVYRAFQIIGVSVSQLSVDQYRGPALITSSSLLSNPDIDEDSETFFEMAAMSLGMTGNYYWRKERALGKVVNLKLLNPAEVTVSVDPTTKRPEYSVGGKKLDADDLIHKRMMPRPGTPLGLGPIQAAQIELGGTVDARDYGSQFLSRGEIPSGLLTTDQPLTADEAKTYKAIWRGDGEEIKNGHDTKVLGSGLKYAPLALKPSDIQFLETQQFNKTQLATLLGVPASLLNAVVEGGARTYSNVEQEWIVFNRFTLMAYLRPIELGLSRLLPHGNKARFNVDALLRTDTKTRYESHEIGIRAGFLTKDEARAMEGRAPLTAEQQTEQPTPTEETTNA